VILIGLLEVGGMATEDFIKEVNQERELEKRWIEYEKNTLGVMKCANITYRTAIESGFTEHQAMQMAYAYFSELQLLLHQNNIAKK
jgi:hypothetical protein